ncbi:spermatogenesis-associated protein 22 [Channa argus]|uniref:spermatogenesis-associated protein 22 n=1 Tax=Channa argus TaxID=215402 RepID=UPI003520B518
MQRQQNPPARPEAGGLSVPLFIQKKRNRVPLTSAPSENEFFFNDNYAANVILATHNSRPGTYKCYQSSSSSSDASQRHPWDRQDKPQSTQSQQYGSNRPAPGPATTGRTSTPVFHPYKVGSMCSKIGQPTVRQQDSCSSGNSTQCKYPALGSSEDTQRKPKPSSRLSQMGQQSSYRLPIPTHHYSQQSRPLPPPVPQPIRPSAHTMQSQGNSWNFTNSFESQKSTFEGKGRSNQTKTAQPTPTQQEMSPLKPAIENSLRILTAVINGMRHWSQFKDKVPYLFEIFATLDSAVTLGRHGAKNFLLRDGKEAVQCVFYENEQELPRLIRGQVHRCVGNYDCRRDVLVCVSVRPGLPSELKNAREAVKACDAEMRVVLKLFREV